MYIRKRMKVPQDQDVHTYLWRFIVCTQSFPSFGLGCRRLVGSYMFFFCFFFLALCHHHLFRRHLPTQTDTYTMYQRFLFLTETYYCSYSRYYIQYTYIFCYIYTVTVTFKSITAVDCRHTNTWIKFNEKK